MRADRLVAIVLLLQTHGQLTAGDLAERLETSERTIRRDLDALSFAGVPVYAQRGRGGGWALLGGYRTDLSGLTTDEARALMLVAGPNALAGVGVEPKVKSAVRKLIAALPATVQAEAAAAQDAVLVDPVAWGRKGEAHPTAQLDVLRDAVVRGVQVDITYAKPREAAQSRRVHPFGLVSKGGTWYLLAGAAAGLRTFRLSRVKAVAMTDEPVERPDNFDLAEAWDQVQRELPGRLGTVAVELRVDPEVLPWLRRAIAGWGTLDPSESERAGRGRWPQYTATFPHPSAAAAELVRFGARVEVVSPDDVKAELLRLGRELVKAYS
jgi:predicted DNA-binding transcriptional regulator YafY